MIQLMSRGALRLSLSGTHCRGLSAEMMTTHLMVELHKITTIQIITTGMRKISSGVSMRGSSRSGSSRSSHIGRRDLQTETSLRSIVPQRRCHNSNSNSINLIKLHLHHSSPLSMRSMVMSMVRRRVRRFHSALLSRIRVTRTPCSTVTTLRVIILWPNLRWITPRSSIPLPHHTSYRVTLNSRLQPLNLKSLHLLSLPRSPCQLSQSVISSRRSSSARAWTISALQPAPSTMRI